MDITVYSKPNCVQCDATYRALNKHGIDHEVVDVTQDPVAMELVRSLGYLQVPVVIAGSEHWSGYRPDQIKALVDDAQETPRLVAI